ncbi:hypothetical protein LCGC14_1255090 [marine sediment metagenome]|uniref:Uncharacterized protein n=1 Tax=marine sediment metagenome TaxID=412755 RepID=A0A0F9NJ19_9ZZZZ
MGEVRPQSAPPAASGSQRGPRRYIRSSAGRAQSQILPRRHYARAEAPRESLDWGTAQLPLYCQ